ncbi:hypothetical protein AB4254_08070 [Vibrio breoganii]
MSVVSDSNQVEVIASRAIVQIVESNPQINAHLDAALGAVESGDMQLYKSSLVENYMRRRKEAIELGWWRFL